MRQSIKFAAAAASSYVDANIAAKWAADPAASKERRERGVADAHEAALEADSAARACEAAADNEGTKAAQQRAKEARRAANLAANEAATAAKAAAVLVWDAKPLEGAYTHTYKI